MIFIDDSFKSGEVHETETSLAKILPPYSRFSTTGDLAKKKNDIREAYFDRYFNIS